METKLKTICFLFILFFPGKAYSDSSWWNYFDYAGASWNIEEFKTRADGFNSGAGGFTPGFFSATLNDGVDVTTQNTTDLFLGKKFGQIRGEINYSHTNVKKLRTSYFKQTFYLITDLSIEHLDFNGFYDLFQSKRLNFSIGGGLGIAMVKMTGETYRNSDGYSAVKFEIELWPSALVLNSSIFQVTPA